MMIKKNHCFHLVEMSPWPLLTSMGMLTLVTGIIKFFHSSNENLMIIGIIILFLVGYQWWRDISRESTFQGLHTSKVLSGMKLGMAMFILSEVFFFVSFIWAFFHSSLSPTMELGMMWPPMGITTLNPFMVPLLNTIILLSSGVTVTLAHHHILLNNLYKAKQGMIMTLILGCYFTFLQMLEYKEASFSMSEAVFGSSFYMTTGFHGIHVSIGTIFLLISFIHLSKGHFSKNHHLSFEAAAWYWHFVDVVWLFLYMSMYVWGS